MKNPINTDGLQEQDLRDKINFAGGYAAGMVSSPIFWAVEAVAFTAGAAGAGLTSLAALLERSKPEEESEKTTEETDKMPESAMPVMPKPEASAA